jgi:hypothetical protein
MHTSVTTMTNQELETTLRRLRILVGYTEYHQLSDRSKVFLARIQECEQELLRRPPPPPPQPHPSPRAPIPTSPEEKAHYLKEREQRFEWLAKHHDEWEQHYDDDTDDDCQDEVDLIEYYDNH